MIEKLKIHDGDTPGKTFEVKLEYPKSKVATMSDMKCPFCNQKLEPIGTSGQFQCGTWGCDASFNFIATRDVWEYIDHARKALEIAVDALKDFSIHPDNSVKKYAKKALEQITALEQKDVK